jgi:type II secretory pathway pseudopilin PulG
MMSKGNIQKRKLDNTPGETGMTVVELLISILLSSVLTTGVFYLYTNQTETYGKQARGLSAQQKTWAAAQYLQRHIRMGGYGFGGCRGGKIVQWSGTGSSTVPSQMSGLRVYNSCNLLKTKPADCPAAPLTSAEKPDSLSITYSTMPPGVGLPAVRVTKEMPTSSANFFVDSPGGFQDGDILAIWEVGAQKDCTLFKLTADPQAVGGGKGYKLLHNPEGEYNPPGGHNVFPTNGYAIGSLVSNMTGGSMVTRHFAVDESAGQPTLVTWTTDNANPSADVGDLEVIATGVEDLQLAWACDANGDGLTNEGKNATERTSDEWAGNVVGDTVPVCNARSVSEVRISLSVRTSTADEKFRQRATSAKNYRPALEDRAAGTAEEDLERSGGIGTYVRRQITVRARAYNMAGAPE